MFGHGFFCKAVAVTQHIASFSLSPVVSFISPFGRIFLHLFIHSVSLDDTFLLTSVVQTCCTILITNFTNWSALARGQTRPENIVTASSIPGHHHHHTPAINIGLQISEIYLFALLFDNKLKFHYHFLTGSFISRAIHSFPLN